MGSIANIHTAALEIFKLKGGKHVSNFNETTPTMVGCNAKPIALVFRLHPTYVRLSYRACFCAQHEATLKYTCMQASYPVKTKCIAVARD